MVLVVCEICTSEEAKYCCPVCSKRTCSLKCINEHKQIYSCLGLKRAVSVPEANFTGKGYTEEVFLKDYTFLEGISTYTGSLETGKSTSSNTTADLKTTKSSSESEIKREAELKMIKRIAKLSELRALPPTFSRAKQNRTRINRSNHTPKALDNEDIDGPESKTSRRATILWTIDLITLTSSTSPSTTKTKTKTIHDIPDDTPLISIAPSHNNLQKIFLKNETRQQPQQQQTEPVKWIEIPQEKWTRPLSAILHGSRCFEYPIFSFEFEVDE